MVALTDLVNYTNTLLDIDRFQDYCPNGLQVQGKEKINKIVSGVTASRLLIENAIKQNADLILVHHGYFWRGEDPRIIGMKQIRLKLLLQSEINLLAYHLPLDAHEKLGNNAQLAKHLNLNVDGGFGEKVNIGMYGRLPEPMTAREFTEQLEQTLGQKPLYVAGSGHSENDKIQTVAWCTGAAQGYIEQALVLGVDAYLTGEASEQTVHIARECNIHFFSAGHHATERFGVQALGEHLAGHFSLQHQFVDIENPV